MKPQTEKRVLVTGDAGFLGSHLFERLLCDPIQRMPDITLAQEKMDWTPEIKLEDGLAQTIAYFKKLLPN